MKQLTVNHLQDATVARDASRQLESSRHHVARLTAAGHGLVGLSRAARRVHVVTAGVVGVDGARVSVARVAVERVHVEAPLGHYAVWSGRKIVGVAEEHLDVALQNRNENRNKDENPNWVLEMLYEWWKQDVDGGRGGRGYVPGTGMF